MSDEKVNVTNIQVAKLVQQLMDKIEFPGGIEKVLFLSGMLALVKPVTVEQLRDLRGSINQDLMRRALERGIVSARMVQTFDAIQTLKGMLETVELRLNEAVAIRIAIAVLEKEVGL